MSVLPSLSSRDIAELLHELRTPLGGLRAMCDLVELGGSPDAMAALRASIDHLEAIANRVLGMDGVTAKRQGVQHIVAALRSIYAPLVAAKGMTLVFDVTAAAAQVDVDTVPFRQVLENLLNNAIRLQERGLLEVSVHLRRDGRLSLMVCDEGPGISQGDAGRIIAEGGAVAGQKGGAGLGLSICGKLVAAQGGILTGGARADGKPGAEFRFDWPGNVEAADKPASVLIVDDHPASRQVLRTILGAMGVNAREAEGVDAALVLIESHEFGLVMTDLQMDSGGGNRLIEALRQIGYAGKIAVVSADRPDLPVDSFVMKPISVKAIAEMLRETGMLRQAAAA